jgi:hypothetical protein
LNCEEFRQALPEVIRNSELGAHAGQCAACAEVLVKYRTLAAQLGEVGRLTRGRMAPPRVETLLLSEYRRQHPARRWKPGRIWAPALVAAGVVLTFGIWREYRPESGPATPVPAAPVPVTQARVPSVERPAKTGERNALAMRKSPPPGKVRTPVADPPPAMAMEPEETTGFIPLPYAAALGPADGLDIVRLRLPRSAMMRFGLPVSAERAWEPVKADVAFGQDGVARAIRFVK